MNICVSTQDAKLRDLCRDIFGQFTTQTWNIMICEGDHSLPEADLYIWDFESETALPDTPEWRSGTKLFLVHRMDLPAFRKQCSSPELSVLLKPVTRSTLAAFIEHFTESRPNAATLRSDRDYLLQSLINANLRLQECDQDRSSFIARVVHDFRAPLTAISGYCGLLLADVLGPLQPQQKEILTRMNRSATRLFALADAMLGFNSGGRVERETRLEAGDLQSVVSQALHELRPSFSEKNIVVDVSISTFTDVLYFDAGQIEQALVNLLENAYKFTPKNGAVKINAYPYFWERRSHVVTLGYGRDRRRLKRAAPNCIRVDIQDSGPGIPDELCRNVFEEFTTYSGGSDRSGAGLGLAICKLILQRHKGRIWVEPSATGSLFSFVLPLCNAEAAEVQGTSAAAGAR